MLKKILSENGCRIFSVGFIIGGLIFSMLTIYCFVCVICGKLDLLSVAFYYGIVITISWLLLKS